MSDKIRIENKLEKLRITYRACTDKAQRFEIYQEAMRLKVRLERMCYYCKVMEWRLRFFPACSAEHREFVEKKSYPLDQIKRPTQDELRRRILEAKKRSFLSTDKSGQIKFA